MAEKHSEACGDQPSRTCPFRPISFQRSIRYPRRAEIAIATEKTSLSIDRKKADEAARILGTKTLTATVDAALAEVIRQHRLKRLITRLRASDGGIGPSDDERRRLRTP